MKLYIEENYIETYSTYNEVDERIIRTLKNNTYKQMTVISNNIDK